MIDVWSIWYFRAGMTFWWELRRGLRRERLGIGWGLSDIRLKGWGEILGVGVKREY